MSTVSLTPPVARGRLAGRSAGLLLGAAALVLGIVLSLAVGTRSIGLGTVVDVLLHGGDSQDARVVLDLRLPRTGLAILVGIALGVGGALVQALTRNPLADPGILGVNAGAALAVVIAIGFVGISGTLGYVWFAFLGAGIASVVVFTVGGAGRGGSTPVRLALAGTALTISLISVTYGIVLTDRQLLQQFTLWSVGSLSGRDAGTGWVVLPFVLAGVLVAAALARPLNALALGDDSARALGTHVGRTRIAGAAAVTLLCGAATAAAGPITFVGLTVPHVARAIVGPDQRWVLAYSALLGPALVLLADVLGRVIARPGELQVSIVLAFVGAPVFIAIVRRKRIAAL